MRVTRRPHLHPNGRLEGADQLRRGVPRVGVRPPDLRLPQVLVVDQDVRQRRRDRRVQHRVDRHVQARRRVGVDLDVLVLDVQRRRDLDPVGHVPPRPLLVDRLGVAGGHLREPVERAVAQDLRDPVPALQLADPPRHEPVREHGPHRLAAEGDVVPVQELLEPLPAPLAADLAEQPLREARALHDVEALQHRRLVRHQLPQEVLALGYVPRAHARADPRHLAHHFGCGCARRKGVAVKYPFITAGPAPPWF